ncbi:MAG: hypothetical protein NC548_05685 [Lachnospiraceae bacterium]|nr:hypothetical protein [Lachnospiraceae bacterium]
MKQNWNDMNCVEKTWTMLSVFMTIVGWAMMYYSVVVTVSCWIIDHIDAIKHCVISVMKLAKSISKKVTTNYAMGE